MTRLLVTGASGLLGSAMVYRGRERFRVLAATHRNPLRPAGFETRAADLEDRRQAAELVRDFDPDWICHCAALTDVDLCQRQPEAARRVNVAMTEHVAVAAAEAGKRLLMVSTDAVFDGERGGYAETDAPNPVNEYAGSKLEAERRAAERVENVLIARVNFFGWNIQRKQSLAEWVLGRLRAGGAVTGWTDVFFTPLYNLDLADWLLEAIGRGLKGVYHAAGRERCSKFDFAKAVARTWGMEPDRVEPGTLAGAGLCAPRPRDTSLLCGKAERAVGRPMPGLASGLSRMRIFGETELPMLRNLLVE